MDGSLRERRTSRRIVSIIASVILAAGVLLAGAGPASATTIYVTFSYTGSEQTFTVPGNVSTIHVVAIGAPGDYGAVGSAPGRGAEVTGDLSVTPGGTLDVEVGGRGYFGGFNGGGAGGGTGGGASDVRTVSIGTDPSPGGPASLASRLIVAAGGGGGGDEDFVTDCAGGGGGDAGAAGSPGQDCGGGTASGGAAGAASLGVGGSSSSGGGGGGGLYGGAAGGESGHSYDGRTSTFYDGTGGGGGGGGTNLVPPGGSADLVPLTDAPRVTISYAGAANPPCKVTNLASLTAYGGTGANLQIAIDAAEPGVTLQVQGTCVGNFTVSGSVNLKGKTSTAYPKKAMLDGDASGTVLLIYGGTVSLRNLKITDGTGQDTGAGVRGGGIFTVGDLSLDGATVVTGNTAESGGGVWVSGGASLTMNDGSAVNANTATSGGGVGIDALASVTMNGHAKVAKNHAGSGGGISSSGDLTMHGRSSVKGNVADRAGGIDSFGSIAMNDSSIVVGNRAAVYDGGGIFSGSGASLAMNDSSTITGNGAAAKGGGVYAALFSALTGAVDGTNVFANTPDNIYMS